ncbi:MAG TPA: hypothetical protein VG963_05720 [Polyangiaceae bacterium]|nr:hypothetical protein [Polyangiaceae bacterium]
MAIPRLADANAEEIVPPLDWSRETTRVLPRQPRRVAAERLEYHLFRPRKAHDPLLEHAYEVWRDGWKATLFELDGTTELYSDDFARQDEIAVVAFEGRCVAVNGLRWLDLSLPRAREDSFFKHWPTPALARMSDRVVTVGSNTLIHPTWRGTLIEPPQGKSADPERLAFTTIALTVRRFLSSSAQSLIALTRNDRAIDRVLAALGATTLARIQLHGVETDIICVDRSDAVTETLVVNDLWARRHQT